MKITVEDDPFCEGSTDVHIDGNGCIVFTHNPHAVKFIKTNGKVCINLHDWRFVAKKGKRNRLVVFLVWAWHLWKFTGDINET